MTVKTNNFKYKLFKALSYLKEWRPQSELAITLYLLTNFVAQISLINYHLLDPQQESTPNELFSLLKEISTYIYFTSHPELYTHSQYFQILLGLSIAIIVFFLLIVFIGFHNSSRDWQGFLFMTFSYIFMVLTPSLYVASLHLIKTSINQSKSYLLPIGLISAVMLLVYSYLTEQLMFTIRLTRHKNFDRGYCAFRAKKKLMIRLLTTFLVLRGEYSQVEAIISVIIMLLLFLAGYFFKMNQIGYFNQFISKTSISLDIIQISFYFLTLIQINIILLKENLAITIITTSIGFFYSQKVVGEYFRSEIFLKDIEDINSVNDGFTYLKILSESIINYNDTMNSTLLSALIYHHRNICRNLDCFCHKKFNAPLYKNQQFLREFGLHFFGKMEEKFCQSTSLVLTVINYRVEVCGKFPLYLQKLKEIEESQNVRMLGFFWIHEEFMIYQIVELIRQMIRKINEKQKGSICDEVFEHESMQKQAKEYVQKILEGLIRVYKYLNRAVCNFNSLDGLLLNIYKNFIKVNDEWKEIKRTSSKSMNLYHVFYFYFNNILSLASEKKKILEKITNIMKKMKANLTKQFDFNYMLFSKNGVVVETPIQPNKFGIIKRVSENGENFFSMSAETLVGMKIDNIIPHWLRSEHEKVLTGWLQNNRDDYLNIQRSIFFINGSNRLIYSKMILRISMQNDQLKMFASMIKINDRDFLAINQSGLVESYGSGFQEIYGDDLKGRKFSDACKDWEELLKTASLKKQKAQLRLNEIDFLTEVDPQNDFNASLKNDTPPLREEFHGEVQYYYFGIRKKKVLIIKLQQLTRTGYSKQQMKTIYSPRSLKNIKATENMNETSEQSLVDKEDNMMRFIQVQSRSSVHEESAYSLQKVLNKIMENALAQQNLYYKPTQILKIILFIMACIILGLIVFQSLFYQFGMFSYSKVIFADSAVNDNMQMLQFLYNKITMIYQYCGDDLDVERCNFVKDSTARIEEYLFLLLREEMKVLVKNSTFFGNFYYEYQFKLINVTVGETTAEMSTTQFMKYFIYATEIILTTLKEEGKLNSETDLVYKLLRDNWSKMKFINHHSLEFYEGISQQELKIVELIMIVLLVIVSIGLSIFIFFIFYFHRFMEKKRQDILFLFRQIPLSGVQGLKNYYQELATDLTKKNIGQLIEKQNPIISMKKSTKNLDYKFKLSIQIKVILFALWSLFCFLNIYIFLSMTDLFPKCIKMVENINNLMDSENYLLENYFELKVYYLQEQSKPYPEFQAALISTLKQNEVVFNEIALEAMTTFLEDDDTFLDEFSSLLITDVCKLTKNFFNQSEIQKCQQGMHYKMLEVGLLPSMTYFQRIVYQAVFDLKKNSTNPDTYFKQKIFEDLDDYIFYMFKLYQETQSRMNAGLEVALTNRINFLIELDVIQGVILVIVMIIWIINSKKQNAKLSQLYGYITLYPKAMLKENKNVLRTLEQVFDEI